MTIYKVYYRVYDLPFKRKPDAIITLDWILWCTIVLLLESKQYGLGTPRNDPVTFSKLYVWTRWSRFQTNGSFKSYFVHIFGNEQETEITMI